MLPELTGVSLSADPNKTAIVFNNQRMTYGQLETHVQGIANTLVQSGYNGSHRIAIIAKNSLNYFALYLACRRTNNIAVMINWKLPVATQEKMIAESRVSKVYRDIDLMEMELTGGVAENSSRADSPVLLLYTNGSTGDPKAAVISNANRQSLMRRMIKLPPTIRIVTTPFYHINGLNVAEHTLTNNGTLILMSEFDTSEYLSLLAEHRIPQLNLVPSMMAMILNHPNISDYDFGFVRGIIMSTSPVSMKLYENTKKVFYNAGVSVGYGLTEIGPVFGKPPPGMTEPPLTCGYPQKGVDYKLVDGILYVKSASMSIGYDNTDTTKIVDGWLNTGDLFRIDENGFYFFMGRADDMYKVGGEQVYPSEIESSLESIDGVDQACVIMLEDDIKGYKPYAFCTGSFDKDTVTTELLTMLPRFKIPRNIWCIDSFPLIGVGKIDRRALTNKAKEML